MRIFNFYLLLICFLFAGSMANSQTLDKIYSGGKLPAEEAWQELKLDAAVNPVAGTVTQEASGGALKLKSTNAADQFTQLGWYKTGLGFNLATGYTIEIKAKVSDASKYGAFNIQGFDNEGVGFRIGIYDNYLAEQTNPFAATNVLKDGLNNGDGFHIYRIAVKPTGIATVYRDDETIGTFPLSAFYFDNIIENGGFEDGDDPNDASYFPNFITNASMYRSNEADCQISGDWGLIMDNEELPGPNPTDERARTGELAIKPGADYNVSFSRRRIVDDYYAWRDVFAFWDNQEGTQKGADVRDPHAISAGANENYWQVHNQTITAPEEDVNSLHFEFTSWVRDGGNWWIATAFDNFYMSEEYGLAVGPQVTKIEPSIEPIFQESYVNLIKNGDFEDHNMNNDGTDYEWTLSNEDNNNEPVGYNALWGGDVRIQKNDKEDDQLGGQWAHGGTSSLRFSSLGSGENNFNYAIELEPNKTYRYNFWMRSPHWDDFGSWLKVKIGDNVLWGHELKGRNNVWSNVDLTFTTTAGNTTLSLYTECGGWFNIYLDDFVLYEVTEADPYAGKTNLFANGDFENTELGNDGATYAWALASGSDNPADDNYPVEWSDFWGTYVRLQDVEKSADTGVGYAYSGNNSMRFSRLNDNEKTNMDMNMELEPNKTYTLVFRFKTANYPDNGTFYVANGDLVLWGGEFGTKYINWSKQTVTFSTTTMNHTLRMYTDISSWFNFYLDDIALYEEDTYIPLEGGDTYLFFGKSTGTSSADVEIEYVAVDVTGGYAPGETSIQHIDNEQNLNVYSSNGTLRFNAFTPASVAIYNVAGTKVSQFELNSSKSIKLPHGVYIVKSVSRGVAETLKVVNK